MTALPHIREIAYGDPLVAFAPFAGDEHAFLLDSALQVDRLGRYSFFGTQPFVVLKAKNGRLNIDGETCAGDPFAALRGLLGRYPLATREGFPPLQTGAVGFFAYDLCHHLERLPAAATDDMAFSDMAVGLYDLVVAFDHHVRRAWIVSSGYPETDDRRRMARARERADATARRMAEASQARLPELPSEDSWAGAAVAMESNFRRADYEAVIRRVIEYILAGDIFQANVAQRFSAPLPAALSPFDLYRRLRRINPAPFAAYLGFGDEFIASSSPERFLQLRGGWVESRPIKGTRPRGNSADADATLARELLESAKDNAENLMIVDLLRNDLSRVCRDDSVRVPDLCVLEPYATVFHLVSSVIGRLNPGADAIDLLRASFPGGSITGAPKIRAMEIIAELEPTRRGPYCGSVGYIGFDGSLDTSIVIRTFAIRNGTVTFQAGGGIVADSDPADEYDETIAKARALMRALGAEGWPEDGSR